MALNIEIRVVCSECDGSGEVPYDEGLITCSECAGNGYHAWPIESSDLEDKLNDIEDKCNDILDKCDDILEEVQGE